MTDNNETSNDVAFSLLSSKLEQRMLCLALDLQVHHVIATRH